MTVEERQGSVLDSDAQTIVNTVNTVGVMGKGLALEFKKRYPKMFDRYKLLCRSGELRVGKLHLYPEGDRLILNFPTKSDFRHPSKLEYIEKGLQTLVKHYRHMGVTSIAFPRLGCGLGGLDWENQVRPMMEKHLLALDIPVYVYDGVVNTGDMPTSSSNKARKLRSVRLSAEDAWRDVMLVLNKMPEKSVRIDLFTWIVPLGDSVELRSGEIGRHLVEQGEFATAWNLLTSSKQSGLTVTELQTANGLRTADHARATLLVLEVLPYVRASDPHKGKSNSAKQRSYTYLRAVSRPSPTLREMLL